MIYQHLEILSTLEKEGDEYYLIRTIKSEDEIVYHSRVNALSKAADSNPIAELESFISPELSSEKPKCCCDRCCNPCYACNSIGKPRINLLSKFRQFIIKLLKIRPQ